IRGNQAAIGVPCSWVLELDTPGAQRWSDRHEGCRNHHPTMKSPLSSAVRAEDLERGPFHQTSSLAPKRARRPSIRQAYFGDYEQIAAAEAASGLTPRAR